MKLTGYKNVDILILNKLDDKSLFNLFDMKLSLSLLKISNNQDFWLQRILNTFPYLTIEILKEYRPRYRCNRTWKQYYINDLSNIKADIKHYLSDGISRGRLDHVIVALKNGIFSLDCINTYIYHATQKKRLNIIEVLLEALLDIEVDVLNVQILNLSDSLKFASRQGSTDIVKVLLTAGAYVHASDDLSLCWACESGHFDTVKVLLAAGANIHARDNCPVRMARFNGHLDIVKLLLEYC